METETTVDGVMESRLHFWMSKEQELPSSAKGTVKPEYSRMVSDNICQVHRNLMTCAHWPY